MMFQAYVDDSMAQDQVLALAGYIAPVERWRSFSDEWRRLLDMRPPWPYFKMSEVATTEDELRWERAGWFYRAIEEHAQAFVAVVVEIDALRRVVRELGLPESLENPYVTAFRAIADFTAQYQHELGITEPIDFIFDEHGQSEQVRHGFEVFRATQSPEMKERLGRTPRFERDTDLLPLQAADLLAWHVRRHWLVHKSITTAPIGMSWPPRKDVIGYKFNMDYADLLRNLLAFRQTLKDAGLVLPDGTIKVTFSGLDGREF